MIKWILATWEAKISASQSQGQTECLNGGSDVFSTTLLPQEEQECLPKQTLDPAQSVLGAIGEPQKK